MFSLVLTAVHFFAKFVKKFLASFVPVILEVKKLKSGSRDPHMIPFDLILHFFSLVLTAVHLCAKFEVSSIIRPGDIRSDPKLQKWVT